VPIAVGGLAGGVAVIATGGNHTCARTTEGGVKCWGANFYGALGDNSTTDSSVPVAVTGLSSGVAAITAGSHHTCALTTVGAVQCWGSNFSGELGNNTTTNSAVPVVVTGLASGVAAIAAGGQHTCALTTAGTVQCWGTNGYGQLGNNSTASSSVPVGVTNLSSGVAAITAGNDHSCALTTAGAVQCWGLNVEGQLGNNSTASSSVPVGVTNLSSGVAAITAGNAHSCALTTAGSVQCWGHNVVGQLGNNSLTNSLLPVTVTGLASGVAAVTAGVNQSCARTTANAAKCWGANNFGQLGNNSLTNSTVPVAVSGLASGVAAVTAGGYHACALTTTGTVKCWGRNDFGQLGNTTTTSSLVPISILAGQSMAFAPPTTMSVGNPINLTATATGGGSVAIVFDTWTTGTCSVSGTTLTATSTAICGVRASRAGGSNGSDGTTATSPQKLRLIQVQDLRASQSIVFPVIAQFSWYQGSATLAATASSGLTVSYSVSFGPCSLAGIVLTASSPGDCVITADQSGNASFASALKQSQSVTVNVGPALLDIDASGASTKYDAVTDGLMVMRFLMGFQGNAITDIANAGLTSAQVLTHLGSILPLLDVDGDRSARGTSDGLLILRYMLGLRGAALLAGAAVGPATAAEVETAIGRLMPP
jgi:alpha-tubulin suppressor-like RCC1 family protein